MLLILNALRHRAALTLFTLVLALGSTVGATAPLNLLDQTRVSSEQVTAELLLHAPNGIAPGAQVWAGLQLTHAPQWHTYWKNSGDSGLPTELAWQLPTGVTAGDIAWPTPKKFPLGPLANHGYDGTVLLVVPLTIEPAFQGKTLTLGLEAAWLACRKECIPEEASLRLTAPTDQPVALHGAAFEASQLSNPTKIASKPINISVTGQFLQVKIPNAPSQWVGKPLVFFPEHAGLMDAGTPWEQAWEGPNWSARIPLSPMRADAPTELSAVLALADVPAGQPAPAGVAFTAPVSGTWPPALAVGPTGVSDALQAALADNASSATPTAPPSTNSGGPTLGLWAALVGALLGGMVLNLMPCVFPVLAIKVLAFAQHADDHRTHRLAGLAYTAGVVLSFLALGGLLLALRSAGEQLGWGFQLQSPAVVAALAVLFTLIALNLLGVFEVGSLLPSSVASLQAKSPTVDALLTGVLATAVASPCTAPFMGASLGLAIGLPTAQALAVFATLGLGMALPYLAASWVPALARALPRPGAWMETFRHFMAFPMWATVVWLLWVLGQQSGIDGAAALLMLLVALSWLVWALGLHGRSRAVLSLLVGLGLAWLVWAIGPNVTRPMASTDAPALATEAGTQGAAPHWQAWSAERQAQLQQAGQPVFVDFTAAWCVTCQYNKRTALADERVLARVAERGVTLLRADWTRRDPRVTEALAQLGRNGVPVYALHSPGQPTTVLSEVLSADEVLSALAPLPVVAR